MVYSEYTKPTPKKIDLDTLDSAFVPDQSNHLSTGSGTDNTNIKRWALYVPCYKTSDKTELTGYRALFSQEDETLKFGTGSFVYNLLSPTIFHAIYGKPTTSTQTSSVGTGICTSGYKATTNFNQYIGSTPKKSITAFAYNVKFVVLEKNNSNLSDDENIYGAKNESDEKRAILLFPLDMTKLLIDSSGKLTFNSASNPPPTTDKLVEN